MPFAKPNFDQLRHRFLHHPPSPNQAISHQVVREAILTAAATCVNETPVSPEQARALNALDEAMFLFSAAIARNQPTS